LKKGEGVKAQLIGLNGNNRGLKNPSGRKESGEKKQKADHKWTRDKPGELVPALSKSIGSPPRKKGKGEKSLWVKRISKKLVPLRGSEEKQTPVEGKEQRGRDN